MKKWEKPMLNDLSVRKTTVHTSSDCPKNSDGVMGTVITDYHCEHCDARFMDYNEAYEHELCCEKNPNRELQCPAS